MKTFLKTLITLTIIVAFLLTGCDKYRTKIIKGSDLAKEEQDEYIAYIEMLPFTFEDPKSVESFRYGTFYAWNAAGIEKYDPNQFAAENQPYYEIPQEIFEEFICKYFNISTKYLRSSYFYDSEKQVYTGFLAGEGIPCNYKIVSVEKKGNTEVINYLQFNEESQVSGTMGIEHTDKSVRFLFNTVKDVKVSNL